LLEEKVMATTVDPQPLEKAEFDPFGPAFRHDPEAFYGDLVNQTLGFMTMEGVRSSWVGSHAQCLRVLRDHGQFSSLKPKGLPGMERVDFFNGLPVMNYSDPPDHTRRRKVVNSAFLPKRTEPLTVEAARIIDEVFDRVADRGGRIDAVGELTKQLSMRILLDHFLKVDKQDQRIFLEYFGTFPLFDTLKPGDPKPQPFLDVWEEGQAYCRHQYALAREGKSDNLIALIARSVDEGVIGEDEMLAMMIVLLVGGVSTVAAAAGSALLRLAWNPDIADRIRADPALAARHHEESLRIDPPVAVVLRFGTDESEIAGTPIPRDMPVYVMLASANRDPGVFPDPDRFSIDRSNSHMHLSFGYGIHTCIGNAITRNLVPLLIRKAVERFGQIELADDLDAIGYDSSNPRGRHLSRLMLELR
jgi:cytochrome P450